MDVSFDIPWVISYCNFNGAKYAQYIRFPTTFEKRHAYTWRKKARPAGRSRPNSPRFEAPNPYLFRYSGHRKKGAS